MTGPSMIVTTTNEVAGRRIREYKGVVRGILVRAPTISQGILGGLKSIIGGSIGAYTDMCEQARQHAYDRMVEHAREVGATAVVGMRFDAGEVASKASATPLPPAKAGHNVAPNPDRYLRVNPVHRR